MKEESIKNVFKLKKFAGELAQLSGDFVVTGAGFLTVKVCDIVLSYIDKREKNRLESSTRAIYEKIDQRSKAGETPNDLSMVNYQEPIINELLIHTLTKCRDEPEEKKNHFTENVFVNVLFDKGNFLADGQWGHSAIKDIERFTYNQILLFNFICSNPVITSVKEENYEDYISIFQSPFGVKYDRNTFYESNQQLILNDFHTLYGMQYLIEWRHIADLHFQNGNVSEADYPFFSGVLPSPAKGLRIKELFFSDTNVPEYLQQDTSKLEDIIFLKEKLDNYIEKYL